MNRDPGRGRSSDGTGAGAVHGGQLAVAGWLGVAAAAALGAAAAVASMREGGGGGSSYWQQPQEAQHTPRDDETRRG
jgi:hypothetical protein